MNAKHPTPVLAKGTTTHQLPKPATLESSLIPDLFSSPHPHTAGCVASPFCTPPQISCQCLSLSPHYSGSPSCLHLPPGLRKQPHPASLPPLCPTLDLLPFFPPQPEWWFKNMKHVSSGCFKSSSHFPLLLVENVNSLLRGALRYSHLLQYGLISHPHTLSSAHTG